MYVTWGGLGISIRQADEQIPFLRNTTQQVLSEVPKWSPNYEVTVDALKAFFQY
jgi:hypothetical protein